MNTEIINHRGDGAIVLPEEFYLPTKVRNPLDDAALIFIGRHGEELYREVGWGVNKRIIYPDGKIVYLNKL